MTKNSPIGFFDSGVGGLSVYSKFRQLLPNENTIYFGDLKNLPYGNKTQEELISFAETFDLFAMNLNNIIMSGVLIFDKEDVSNIIVKKYRLSKINISDEDLHTDNIENLINKITLLQRVNKIENSEISVDKIWFMVKVKEINERLKEK